MAAGPVVGRQQEVAVLEAWFQRAATGTRQLVFVSGDVGTGKTALVDLWLGHGMARSGVRMARGRCVEHYGEGEPYLPLLEALGQLSRGPDGQDVLAALRRYAPMWLVQLPGVVPKAELERLQRQLQGATRARMLGEFADALDVLADGTPEVRQMLEVASVVGEEWAVAAVAAGAQRPIEDIEAVCDELAGRQCFIEDSGVTVWPDGTSGGSYRFLHALYSQVLYEQLGTARRRQLHRRIGTRLEAGYGARAGDVTIQLAIHFERGGETSQAVHYWQQVGDIAARRNAYHEAVAALRQGLALQLTLGELLMAAKGMASPEAGEAFTRAHTLCQHVGETAQHVQVLRGLCRFHGAQARLRTADALSQRFFHLAQRQHDPTLLLEGRLAMGVVAFYRDDLVAARDHLEQSLALCDTPQLPAPLFPGGYELGVIHSAYFALLLWVLGYPDQAQQRSQEALVRAQQVGHTPSLAFAAVYASMLSQFRRDAAATQAGTDALMSTAAAQDLGYRVEQGSLLRGWALAMQGDAAVGVAQIRQGLAAAEGAGLQLFQPYRLTLLAEGYGQAGQPETGLRILAEALTAVAATEERRWEAEVHRLKGALLCQLPVPDVLQAEGCFQQALAVARSQHAKSLELRAAMSLSRLWQQQGQHAAARELLAPIYAWFTEGFDTADLQGAKPLLEA